MFLNETTELGINAVLKLAENGNLLTIPELAIRLRVSPTQLHKVLEHLQNSKIVQIVKGKGVYLLVTPENLSFKRVLEAMEGKITDAFCLFNKEVCELADTCRFREAAIILQNKFNQTLEGLRINSYA